MQTITTVKTETCEDGEMKKMDCNHCSCVNGNWICTLMGCNSLVDLTITR